MVLAAGNFLNAVSVTVQFLLLLLYIGIYFLIHFITCVFKHFDGT